MINGIMNWRGGSSSIVLLLIHGRTNALYPRIFHEQVQGNGKAFYSMT